MTTPFIDVSVVVATLNRSAALRTLLHSLVSLSAGALSFEIIVVDNGSRDDTPAVVERFSSESVVPVRYVLQPRPGVSNARNAGVSAASAPIVAFTDDDQDVRADWLCVINRVFCEHPDVDVIGGRVHPRWVHRPPDWITQSVWGPVSIIDRGPEPFRVTRERWMCLPGGNMAWRRQALIDLGGFSPEYPRSQDRELTVRALLAGLHAMYVPDMVVHHHIDGQRLTRTFFRRWNRTEGRMRAGYAFEELFTVDGHMRLMPEDTPRLLGVSRFVYRCWLRAVRSYARAMLRAQREEAFRHELRALYLTSYIHRRIDLTAVSDASVSHRASALFARGLTRAAAVLAGILQ
jgi:glycosyltransferase involved in cell wall biosynthesis